MLKRVKKLFSKLKSFHPVTFVRKNRRYKHAVVFIRRRPFASFFLSLLVLLLLIIVGNVISGFGSKVEKVEKAAKEVAIFTIGETPKVTLDAQVKQEGVVQIIAQAPGIVQKINVTEGDSVKTGQLLITLSSNYEGSSAPAIQASIVGAQYKTTKETYDSQKDIVRKQREIANETSSNTDELRKISDNSLNHSRSLINLNNEIVKSLDAQIQALIAGGATEEDILPFKQQKAQVQSGINQLGSVIESTEYQVNLDNPPTKLNDLQKEITLKQLDVQDKMLDLNKQTSSLQYSLALVQASLMRPSSPFNGTVERINVSVGENVSSGDVIATIASTNPLASITVLAPRDIAVNVSRVEPSIIHIGNEKISIVPSYVSTVATEGQLYTIVYNLPEDKPLNITNGGFIPLEIPIGYTDTFAKPFIPIDSVFQSQSSSYVYVISNGKADTRELTLGNVYGSFVEVEKGLSTGDKIILTRNVIEGDEVKVN